MRAVTRTQPTFTAAPSHLLIDKPIANYDAAGDGRILIQEAPNSTAPGQLNVVLNWFEDIRSRMAAAGNKSE
jgi:hypothetical protein